MGSPMMAGLPCYISRMYLLRGASAGTSSGCRMHRSWLFCPTRPVPIRRVLQQKDGVTARSWNATSQASLSPAPDPLHL